MSSAATPATTPAGNVSAASGTTVVRTKPIMTMRNILLMNLGFFGIQYSFGMQQSAVNTIYNLLGANADSLPILNMAGPITGLLVQPVIGAMSDRSWSPRWGRRKPFFLIGAMGCSIFLALFPFASAVWMAAVFLWVLDLSNNTAMEPYRAFISDRLPPSQLAKGFLAQSFFTGFGTTAANLCIMLFPHLFGGKTGSGMPHWVYAAFFIGSVCSIGTVLVSVITTPELPPTESELREMQEKKASGGVGAFFKDVLAAIRDMPTEMRKLALVYLFEWYALEIYWQYVSLAICNSHSGTTDTSSSAYTWASSWVGAVNGTYNVVCFSVAFLLAGMARKHGAKLIHCVALVIGGVGLLIFSHIGNQWLMLVPIIGLGIAWASIMGVPYIMVVRMIPSTRYGVYMGVLNMMIVIPQLLETATFGQVYSHVLGSNPNTAILLAGALLIIGGLCMLWIKEPPIVRDVEALSAPTAAPAAA